MRGFTPRTYGGGDIEKKKQLRDLVQAKISDLGAIQQACRGRRLAVDVAFYFYGRSSLEGRAKKDLDNLFKIVLDTLPDCMERAQTEKGLGLIEGDKDDLIFELRGVKKLVDDERDEGVDIEIFEWLGD